MSFRLERKISVKQSRLIDVFNLLKSIDATYLHEKRFIYSVYFENDRLSMFHNSEEGCVPRKKIRIRVYNKFGSISEGGYFETKISSVEGRFKKSKFMDGGRLATILAEGVFDSQYGYCRPLICVRYMREYYQTTHARVTLDTNIQYSVYGESDWIDDKEISMEIKADWNTKDVDLSDAFPFMQIRFSKYARGCESLCVSKA